MRGFIGCARLNCTWNDSKFKCTLVEIELDENGICIAFVDKKYDDIFEKEISELLDKLEGGE